MSRRRSHSAGETLDRSETISTYEVEFKSLIYPSSTAGSTVSVYARADSWTDSGTGNGAHSISGYEGNSFGYTAGQNGYYSGSSGIHGNFALSQTVTLLKSNGSQYVHFRVKVSSNGTLTAGVYANMKFAGIAPPGD